MSPQVPSGRQRQPWDVDYPERADPFRRMSQQMERMFEELMGASPLTRGRQAEGIVSGMPNIDISETKDALEIEADLPGLDERDIDITLSNGVLTISGERKEERDEKGRNFYRAERSLGTFSRRVALPYTVDEDKIEARFDKGVLHVTLPKSADVKSKERHIQIKKG